MESAAALTANVSAAAPMVTSNFLATAETVTVSIPPPMPMVPEETVALTVMESRPSKPLALMAFEAVPWFPNASEPEVPTSVMLLSLVVLVKAKVFAKNRATE